MCSVFWINIGNCSIQLHSVMFCLMAPAEGLNSMPVAAEVSHNGSVTLCLLVLQVWISQQESSVKGAYVYSTFSFCRARTVQRPNWCGNGGQKTQWQLRQHNCTCFLPQWFLSGKRTSYRWSVQSGSVILTWHSHREPAQVFLLAEVFGEDVMQLPWLTPQVSLERKMSWRREMRLRNMAFSVGRRLKNHE